MTEKLPSDFASYPMGPNVRRFLGLDDMPRGVTIPDAREISEADRVEFRRVLATAIEDHAPPTATAMVDLLEELTAMDFADLAVQLCECNSVLFPRENPEAWIAAGNASLFTGDYVAAEESFREAQSLNPEMMIPYVNLSQILFADNRDEEALRFCEQGLDLDLNHPKLWVTYAKILRETHGSDFADVLEQQAIDRGSWTGECLAMEQRSPNDVPARLAILEKYYFAGERDSDFLIELTGTLGQVGRFSDVTPIVAQQAILAQKPDDLPWQLYANDLQAYLAMGEFENARNRLNHLEKSQVIAVSALNQLREIMTEHEAQKGEIGP